VSDPRRRLGAAGERLAADHLEERGYRVLERNVRRREGEVDLVAIDESGPDPVLVFIEVKLRRPRATGGAIEALSRHKQRRLQSLAEVYAAEHPELPADLRIDLVAIDLTADGAVAAFQHIESAVEG
jgi:putative endonuclease